MMCAPPKSKQVVIHSLTEVDGIRKAARVTASVLRQLSGALRPGITTLQIDEMARQYIAATGGTSAFHNYRGFPGQVCISINDEVVHGIGRPDRILQVGDLVSLDVGIRLNGFIGDTATTICIGGAAPDKNACALLKTTKAALEAGIAAARARRYIGDISSAIESVVKKAGFGIVRDFVGHGCGCELHEQPEVPNFSTGKRGPQLQPGMVLAIEPMVNVGTHEVSVDSDGWTVRTKDGKLSAHFEHMILITERKPEILTWVKKQ